MMTSELHPIRTASIQGIMSCVLCLLLTFAIWLFHPADDFSTLLLMLLTGLCILSLGATITYWASWKARISGWPSPLGHTNALLIITLLFNFYLVFVR